MDASSSQAGSVVLVCLQGRKAAGGSHEVATHCELARQIAELRDARLAGEFDPSSAYPPGRYLIPDDTLTTGDARQLGIRDECDLFGGVVPFAFVATKVIVHGLPGGTRQAPPGWSHALGEQVRDIVLPGYSAFTRDDALAAASALLGDGPVRVKRPYGIGGAGQSVVKHIAQLEAELAGIGDDALNAEGIVIEHDLSRIETLSVGRVRVGDLEACYYGTQRLTTNNHGHKVYGGSDLIVVHGTFDDLERIDMPDAARTAIAQARRFDAAVAAAYPGFFASRRNYDIARGIDANGRAHAGVLEQSWRIGGASGAEIAALKIFKACPGDRVVHASTWETYGPDPVVPAGACVCYHGVDARAGELTKYYRVQAHGGQ